jgi:hypothetical protein
MMLVFFDKDFTSAFNVEKTFYFQRTENYLLNITEVENLTGHFLIFSCISSTL